jgi:putative flippase GtrA
VDAVGPGGAVAGTATEPPERAAGRRGVRPFLLRGLGFLVVGALSAGVDVGLLALLHGVLGLRLVVATSAAFWASLAVNFGLNRSWVFAQTRAGSVRRHAIRYLAAVGLNYAATLAIVSGLVAAGLGYLVAKLAAIAVLAGGNYLLYRRWIFR